MFAGDEDIVVFAIFDDFAAEFEAVADDVEATAVVVLAIALEAIVVVVVVAVGGGGAVNAADGTTAAAVEEIDGTTIDAGIAVLVDFVNALAVCCLASAK